MKETLHEKKHCLAEASGAEAISSNEGRTSAFCSWDQHQTYQFLHKTWDVGVGSEDWNQTM